MVFFSPSMNFRPPHLLNAVRVVEEGPHRIQVHFGDRPDDGKLDNQVAYEARGLFQLALQSDDTVPQHVDFAADSVVHLGLLLPKSKG